MAEMAKIQGRVTISVTITESGDVTDLQRVSGHPLLTQPAMDAVKQWRYQPFVAGDKPTKVRTTVNVIFALGPTAGTQQKYYMQEIRCEDLLRASRYAEANAVCNESVKTAASLPNDLLRITAYGNAGSAASHLNKNEEALENFQGQLKLAKSALPKDSGQFSEIHHNLARTYQAIGQLSEAAGHYSESERILQSEIKSWDGTLGKHPRPADLRYQLELADKLRQTLTEHAALLRQMGDTTGAEELEQRASKLAIPSQ